MRPKALASELEICGGGAHMRSDSNLSGMSASSDLASASIAALATSSSGDCSDARCTPPSAAARHVQRRISHSSRNTGTWTRFARSRSSPLMSG